MLSPLDSNAAQSMAESQELLYNVERKFSFSFISTNFKILADTIDKLETRSLALEEPVNLVPKEK